MVMLLPARTDTKWFHEYVYNKAEIRFIKGRLKFGNAQNSAPFPSMIVIFKGRGEKMNDYISKNEPIEEIKRIYCTSCNSYNGAMCRACEHQDDIDIIEDTKAADVQPVKRGKWIENAGYGGWSNSEFKCPECGIMEYKPTNFCPNCGAELRGIDNG